jgi:hypothetical protein
MAYRETFRMNQRDFDEENEETINEIRSYFASRYGHVSLDQLTDGFILEFMSREYLIGLSFDGKMDCLYDYILSQDLCGVEE